MILEIAVLSVNLHKRKAFEKVYPQAAKLFNEAKGCLSHEIRRSVDKPGNYILLVTWENKEAHTEGFCQSHLFIQFKELLSPFFNDSPQVDHCEAF